MDQKAIAEGFALIGHTVNFISTGDLRYVRGFIISPNGITLGRITVYKGQYDHTKWYWRGEGFLNSSDYLKYAWEHYLRTQHMLSEEEFDTIVHKAAVLRQADLDAKKQWRRENPLTQQQKARGSKRKALQGKDIRRFIEELLSAITGDRI